MGFLRCVALGSTNHRRLTASSLSSTFHQEIVMKLNSKSGATLAAAAATLFLAGSVVSTVSTPANAAQSKCMAGNACKGQSACKGAPNACKCQNACRGEAFTATPESSCAAKGKYMPS